MGQDSSCGICSKHYQDCRHYLKVHVTKGNNSDHTFCGRKANSVVIADQAEYDDVDTDPDDYCKKCVKAIGHRPGDGWLDDLDPEEGGWFE